MKCLTVRRPWANWICPDNDLYSQNDGSLPKNVENRTWTTDYRGPLLIHAGKGWDLVEFDQLPSVHTPQPTPVTAAMGIIGAVNLIDVVIGGYDSPWSEGRGYSWVLEYICTFTQLMFYKGQLGLFDVPDMMVAPYLWACGFEIVGNRIAKIAR